ncbi:GatB/YqeY domain-containing protein [bacterium]|nr:GatB/YqeY domain-containing protein [bacterium]NBX49987.1 GatB/YqeY domain-containing protein [bacterium]
MPSIFEKLQEDMKAAMKGRDLRTLEVLRMTISSVKNKAIELNKELSDAEVIEVVKADAKKIKDALDAFVENAREDLAQKAKEELEVLKKYLPEQLTDEDLEARVKAKIAEMGAQGKEAAGKVMGTLSKELKGIADGSRIKAFVDKHLS